MAFERFQGVLVVGRDKDQTRLRADQFGHFEAVQARHLDVEKHQFRLQFRDGLDGVEAVGALGHDLDIVVARQVFAQHAARQQFVIDDGHPHSCLHHASSVSPVCAGIDIVTSNAVAAPRPVHAGFVAIRAGQALAHILQAHAIASAAGP